jgi:AraC-like DNA-binding protein
MVLLVVLAMAAAVVAWMLREPRVSADDPGTVSPGLSAGEAHDIERRLLALLDAERLFLEPGLTLGAVARRLKVSPRRLSQAISARSGENFRGLVNRKRAQHAAHALGDPTVSITAVMFDAGFGSKSAFQREFRRCHGVSPSEFRQRLSRETGSS